MDVHALSTTPGGLVSRAQFLAAGIAGQRLTEWVRLGLVARVARGIYAVGTIPPTLPDPEAVTRSWRVALSFWSAAAWWGVELPRPVSTMHVTAPRNRNRRAHAVTGVRVHRARLRAHEVVVVRGVCVTTPLRTALDIARHAALEDAVAIIDSFLRKRLFTAAQFDAAALAAAGPGRRRVQVVARLVDPKSGSILESLTRVLLWRNGLLPPASQYLLRHPATSWRGYVDFAWPQLMLVLECDGYEFHISREVFINDRRRWSTIERMGWGLAVVTWFDVTADPDYVVRLVRDLVDPALRHTKVSHDAAATAA